MAEGLSPAKASLFKLELNLYEKEIFCSLVFCHELPIYLHQCQKEQAAILAQWYENGSEITPRDTHKSFRYKQQAQLSSAPDYPRPLNLFSKSLNWFLSFLTTSNIYRKLGWFNSVRLPLLSVNRLVKFTNGTGFIPPSFKVGNFNFSSSALGLFYGLELSIDISMVLKSMLRPGAGESKNLKIRLVNILTKENRPYRIVNDSVWFGINLACFFVSTPVVFILNISGLVFDLVHECVKARIERQRYNRFITKVETRITEIDGLVKKLEEENPNKSQPEYKLALKTLQCERKSLVVLQKCLIEKKKSATRTRLFIIAATSLVLVGMAMFAAAAIAATATAVTTYFAISGALIVFQCAFSFLCKKIKDTYFTAPLVSALPTPESEEDIACEEKQDGPINQVAVKPVDDKATPKVTLDRGSSTALMHKIIGPAGTAQSNLKNHSVIGEFKAPHPKSVASYSEDKGNHSTNLNNKVCMIFSKQPPAPMREAQDHKRERGPRELVCVA